LMPPFRKMPRDFANPVFPSGVAQKLLCRIAHRVEDGVSSFHLPCRDFAVCYSDRDHVSVHRRIITMPIKRLRSGLRLTAAARRTIPEHRRRNGQTFNAAPDSPDQRSRQEKKYARTGRWRGEHEQSANAARQMKDRANVVSCRFTRNDCSCLLRLRFRIDAEQRGLEPARCGL
jgi:hypothetical protein